MNIESASPSHLNLDKKTASGVVRISAKQEFITIAETVSVPIPVEIVRPCAGQERTDAEMLHGPSVLDSISIQIFR